MTKAFSYLRFSTPEQAKGDSHRRQTDLAQRYAAAHGLDLDGSSYRDLGVSSFRGTNARTGALGQFLQAVDSGMVPAGSFLLVENLDRVSRQDPWDALPVFQLIINAGVIIVTLQDGKTWSREEMRSSPMRLFESLFTMVRAHEESDTKSRRLRASWAAKRAKAATKPITSRGPAWLRLADDRASWDVLEDRADVVRAIFNLAARGMGENAIAATLNRDAVATWGDNGRKPAVMWHKSYVSKILRSPSVLGTLVPYVMHHEGGAKVRKAEEPVEGYYPAVVDVVVYRAVQALKATASPARGRHATARPQNVLGGIARCSACGGTMTRVTKGSAAKAGAPKLVCVAAKTGAGCAYRPLPLVAVETALRSHAGKIVMDGPASKASRGLAEKVEHQKIKVAKFSSLAEELLEKADTIREDLFWGLVLESARKKDEAEAKLKALTDEFNGMHGPIIRPRIEAMRSALAAGESMDRGAVNVALRQLFDKAVVDVEAGSIALHWKSGGTSIVPVAVETPLERQSRNAKGARRLPNGEFAAGA